MSKYIARQNLTESVRQVTESVSHSFNSQAVSQSVICHLLLLSHILGDEYCSVNPNTKKENKACAQDKNLYREKIFQKDNSSVKKMIKKKTSKKNKRSVSQ